MIEIYIRFHQSA